MRRDKFREIETEEEFVALLKEHDLFREDDVTFDDLGVGRRYVYTGDDFAVDVELFEGMDICGLLVEGSVTLDYLRVSDITPEMGVFCVTGDLRCKDMLFMTECSSVAVAGDVVIDNVFYADCGNSGLEVNGNLTAKLFFDFQCSTNVRGKESFEHDSRVSEQTLAALGVTFAEGQQSSEAVRAYFNKYDE